jgi:hypothetical protein
MPTPNDGWREPTVCQLMDAAGGQDPVALIEAHAQRLLVEAEARSLPIDVVGIASLLGIRIRTGEGPFAGRIFVDETGVVLLDLNARDSIARRRFTTAHEIMHTAFPGFHRDARYRLDKSVGTHQRSRGEEEFLCDRGAAALLMPAEMVSVHFDASRGLTDVERLASLAQVSLEAAAIRLVSLCAKPTLFLVLELAHAPADLPRLRKGGEASRVLRIRYGYSNVDRGLRARRHAAVSSESPFARAFHQDGAARGTTPVPGLPARRVAFVEAKAYGNAETRRVLAVARPAD